MMEAHRSASISYGKLNRIINNELALRRDQRSNSLEFLKVVRSEQDRLENTAPSILPHIIKRFNAQFSESDIEKPEVAGDLDKTSINMSIRNKIVPLPTKPKYNSADSPTSNSEKNLYELIREPLVNSADVALFPPFKSKSGKE